jgi:hypothetical protein
MPNVSSNLGVQIPLVHWCEKILISVYEIVVQMNSLPLCHLHKRRVLSLSPSWAWPCDSMWKTSCVVLTPRFKPGCMTCFGQQSVGSSDFSKGLKCGHLIGLDPCASVLATRRKCPS